MANQALAPFAFLSPHIHKTTTMKKCRLTAEQRQAIVENDTIATTAVRNLWRMVDSGEISMQRANRLIENIYGNAIQRLRDRCREEGVDLEEAVRNLMVSLV